MKTKYTVGLDFGTNSVRALVVDVANGNEVGTGVCDYAHGDAGVIVDERDPNLARQHPADYLRGAEIATKEALKQAGGASGDAAGFSPDDVIGLGVDTTGSTPLPVDAAGEPLACKSEYEGNPAAMAWLWKDHTAYGEAAEITEAARRDRPQYLAKCGGTYSSEWFWSKILHCLRVAPEVFDAAYTWVEIADWIPAQLSGVKDAQAIRRGICAAGHKGLFHASWGGYPDQGFVAGLDSRLAKVCKTLPSAAHTVGEPAGRLSEPWAGRLGLQAGPPIAVGALDAHLGAVGSGIQPGVLVKIIGTSTCDMMVAPLQDAVSDIPGLCGIVPESILPGAFGFEAGQSAVGDIFNWFVNHVNPRGPEKGNHQALTREAEQMKPGQSGLLCLDWHNGNRTVLVDQRLSGLLVGMTLHTKPAEMYRAFIEGTAFGARTIMERFEAYGVGVDRIVNCGGISAKNPLVMQIYADVMGRPLEISRSVQSCALGACVAGAVVAGSKNGGYDTFDSAVAAMTGVLDQRFEPIAENSAVYDRLYVLYRRLHDIFGTREYSENLHDVMKQLLEIRDQARA